MNTIAKIFTPKSILIKNECLQMATELRKKLAWVPQTSNGMDRIVEFFTITSPYQDKFLELVKKYGVPTFKNQKDHIFFHDFKKFLENSGRSEYGWNRTKMGETSSPNNVFIDVESKFLVKSVAEHLSRRNNPIGEVDSFLKEESRGKYNETGIIEKEFVNPFMKRNYEFLISILEK